MNFLSISFRIRIVSNWTTSISVKVYEYRRYLDLTQKNDLRSDIKSMNICNMFYLNFRTF
jgi:hypothetical protein